MATWDVFHSDRLEVGRGLTTAEVREALARGDLRDDDLIRPAGTTTPWARFVDMPPLVDDDPAPTPSPAADKAADVETFDAIVVEDDGDEDDDDDPRASERAGALGRNDLKPRESEGQEPSSLEMVLWDDDLDAQGDGDDDRDEFDPQEEDEAAAEFTLARGSTATVEELDLAAMVDVAFQLVLFFLVTATTILYKSLEVPKPDPENNPPAAAAQGKSRSLDDLKETYIVVEIDPAGGLKVDNEPTPAEGPALAERLRGLRERTGRKAMLLSADFSTPHRSAVLAYDAANEIGLGIAIARPKPKPKPK